MDHSKEKIAVLVSGGVDSSVALALLVEAGFDVTAFYIKIWLEDELAFLGDCPWEEDLAYVRAVTEKLGVSLEIVPLQKEYWEYVVAEAIREVKAGRTPNPDMLCNARIKFGAFWDAIGDGYTKVATGHYAQTDAVVNFNTQFSFADRLRSRSDTTRTPSWPATRFLKRAIDPVKDQTYFLSQLSKSQLSRALFPIGQYTKPQVRALAEKFQLPNAKRRDSQGICFLGKIPFDEFLRHHLGIKKGPLVEFETGKVLGEHHGFWYFTIGQREGIGLSGGPWYVVAKDVEKNTVCISHAEHRTERARATFMVRDLNWFGEWPEDGAELSVKLRHGPKEYECQVQWQDTETLEVFLQKETDTGVASGQYAVFYRGDYCLGGGVISG
ncbi:MAG: tRNA 2-thiouridine(34) synthase MnmA [Candidatus Moraniibacteriota bacterium]|nr:MAG: tRNA 2-thiouridine(34) synthase MnmA [Candidatus Moranbacteria bacterium]